MNCAAWREYLIAFEQIDKNAAAFFHLGKRSCIDLEFAKTIACSPVLSLISSIKSELFQVNGYWFGI